MLTGVTITGADDQVNYEDLLALSREFPFVEWGLLMSESRAGTLRYPSRRWLIGLENTVKGLTVDARPKLAAHFCGAVAREALAGRLHDFPVIERVQRIQVNGYTPRSPGVVKFARMMPSYELILQSRADVDTFAIVQDVLEIAAWNRPASFLVDGSGGTGRPIDVFPVSNVPMGYAGGIGPDNVVQALEAIAFHRQFFLGPYWIDMESGVRTGDHFDLAKVRAVLEACAPFVGSKERPKFCASDGCGKLAVEEWLPGGMNGVGSWLATLDAERAKLTEVTRERDELTAALRALVEALPKCLAVVDGVRCSRPAVDSDGWWCDEHGQPDPCESDAAPAIRNAIALLARKEGA